MDGYNYLILRNFAKVTRNNIKAHELHLTVYMYVQNSLALLFLETLMLFQWDFFHAWSFLLYLVVLCSFILFRTVCFLSSFSYFFKVLFYCNI